MIKTLKFRKDLARMILLGQKTVMWRLFDDKDLKVGDDLQFIEWETGRPFAKAQITGVKVKQFGAISEPDFLGHERFKDMGEMLQHYRDYYGDRVTMETDVKVIDFKLLDHRPVFEASTEKNSAGSSLIPNVKAILDRITYATLATVDADGQPWNAPVFFANDDKFNFFWGSNIDSQHSTNLRAVNAVYIVVYNSTVPPGQGSGVYFRATVTELSDPAEIKAAHKLLSDRHVVPYWRLDQVQGSGPIRLYKATPEKVWMNGEGEKDGHYIDVRVEVPLLE